MGWNTVKEVDCVLVINSGSSSLKFSLFAIERLSILCRGSIDWTTLSAPIEIRLRGSSHPENRSVARVREHSEAVPIAIQKMDQWTRANLGVVPKVLAVGHRIVHGGSHFRESVLIADSVLASIHDLSSLAPLHNPAALKAIHAAGAELHGVPQIAVFDTAFFTALPEKAFVYPLPYEWYTEFGIRRFGFHGINHAYCAQRASEMLGTPMVSQRVIICHLGNGCSAVAVLGGKPIATTMGFTPLDGLMMGTRPGSMDAGILTHVLRNSSITVDAIDQILNNASGLLGVSGFSSDVRELEKASSEGHERATLALSMFCDRVRASIGALAVTLEGIDALVFTAGIGENSATQRASICSGLSCLSLVLDQQLNLNAKADCDISDKRSGSRIFVIESQEDRMIAQETVRLIAH
jgi:acetate kinase